MDKIFSIALLLDESFLNISIKKAVPPERDTVSLCDSVAIRTQDPRLRRATSTITFYNWFTSNYHACQKKRRQTLWQTLDCHWLSHCD